jgi:hypothetical protein
MALREADIAGRGYGEDPASETRELRAAHRAGGGRRTPALQVKDLALDGATVMRILGIPPSRRSARSWRGCSSG